MTMRARGRLRLGAALLLLAAAMTAGAGCGGGDDGGSEGERTRLNVQLLPISDVVPIYLGIKKGFFREENLDLDIQTAQGGAEVIPLVMNGSVQVGYSNTPSLFTAAVKGLPIQIVAPAGKVVAKKQGKGENLVAAVMVKKDSPIRSAKDLGGKTVAVNTLKNISDVTLNAVLEDNGVDHRRVKYLEVPLPDMLPALDAGRVDAVWIVSPFKTIGEQSGKYRAVSFPLLETRPGQVNTAYFVSRQWAEKNEEVLDRFLTALRKSMDYAATHEQEVRQTLPEYTELPKPLISKIPIGERRPDCRELEASSKVLAGLMVKYGALDKQPDLGELIRPGFCEEGD
jgi:NitT/TauT family transport system substrate-binding protein